MSSVVDTLYLGIHAALDVDVALAALIGDRIYDTKAPEGTQFPYLTIDSPTEVAFEAFGNPGNDNAWVIHIWSKPDDDARPENPTDQKQVNEIYKEVNRLLHNVRLNIAGMSHVVGRCALLGNVLDADGFTRHGIVRYQALSFA